MDPLVRRLIDESDVRKVMIDYARGVDTRDWELVGRVFADDATIAGTRFSGPKAAYLAQLRPGVESFGATMHVIGNQAVEVDGDTARTETYLVARHFRDVAGTEEALTVGVIYRDQLARAGEGRWAVRRRDVQGVWSRAPGTIASQN